MADSPLIIKSKTFALEVIQVCKDLKIAKCESALINQFLRSGTSIGANIREAFYAHGKADFTKTLKNIFFVRSSQAKKTGIRVFL